jgi:hypothetical protein
MLGKSQRIQRLHSQSQKGAKSSDTAQVFARKLKKVLTTVRQYVAEIF